MTPVQYWLWEGQDPRVAYWPAIMQPSAERSLLWAVLGEVLGRKDIGAPPVGLGSFLRARQWSVRALREEQKKVARCNELEVISDGQVPAPSAEMPFSRAVENIAGRVSAILGWEPETATINIYRDEADAMPLHSDGPHMFEDRFVTVSLGGAMTLELQHMRSGERHEGLVSGGSMYVLDGLQREWLHGAKDLTGGPRVGITFIRMREELPANTWTLGDGTHELARAVLYGTREQVVAAGKELADPVICTPRLQRNERAELEAMGVTESIYDLPFTHPFFTRRSTKDLPKLRSIRGDDDG